MDISPSSEILDVRPPPLFKGITFSGFKKADVKKELIKNLIHGKIESCCYWCAEYICAGHFSDIWEIMLHFYSKYIHLGNPKLCIYLDVRFQTFKQFIMDEELTYELDLRNNHNIRKMFCEMICLFCEAKRKHCFQDIKIKLDDFDITHLPEGLKAQNVLYASTLYKNDDPKELFIAMNEFAYHISQDGKHCLKACYWFDWMIEFESICHKRKEYCKAEQRFHIPVDIRHQQDIVWMIWDALLQECKESHPIILQKMMTSLYHLFCIKYSSYTCAKKRKYLVYFAISLLTEIVPLEEEIVKDKEKVTTIVSNIDVIYKQIKKNEIMILSEEDNIYALTPSEEKEKARQEIFDSMIHKLASLDSSFSK